MKTRAIGELSKIKTGSSNLRRPLTHTDSTHLVLRLKPNLPYLFEPHDRCLRENIFRIANKYEIRIYDLIFNHTHLHGVFLFPNRASYVRFIREVTSFMVMYFNKGLSFLGVQYKNIFSQKPFTQAVLWGRAYKRLLIYMKKNEAESGATQYGANAEFKAKFRFDRRKANSIDQIDFFEQDSR